MTQLFHFKFTSLQMYLGKQQRVAMSFGATHMQDLEEATRTWLHHDPSPACVATWGMNH